MRCRNKDREKNAEALQWHQDDVQFSSETEHTHRTAKIVTATSWPCKKTVKEGIGITSRFRLTQGQ